MTARTLRHALIALTVGFAPIGVARAAAPVMVPAAPPLHGTPAPHELKTPVTPFLAEHCVDCHGPDKQKGGLRLDTLEPAFGERDAADVWVKVLDKVTSGEMPPPRKARPPQAETAAATAWIGRQLHDASLARQQKDGRVVLRRLNGTEYENTLRDLLADPALEVSDLLPDDNSAGGFDNVSAVLDVSSAHFLKYQEAAEKALAAVVPTRDPQRLDERLTGKQVFDRKQSGNRPDPFKERAYRVVDGDALAMYGRLPSYAAVNVPTPTQAGTYRVRLSVHVTGTGGKIMPLVLTGVHEVARGDGEVRAVRDVPGDGKSFVIEETLALHSRERLMVTGFTLPTTQELSRLFKDALPADYAGPALVLEWMDISGPTDTFPGEGYRRLFGDLPLKPRSLAKAEAAGTKLPKINKVRSGYEWEHDPLIPVSTQPREDAARLLRDFLPRAFRRPVGEDIVGFYVKYALGRLDKGYEFGDAMLTAYKAVLCSPHFLLFDEHPGTLDGYAVAARLSYFLWSSPPDADLLSLAERGELTKPAVLNAQVERMLKDPKANRFVEDFTGQWLDLRKMHATTPDPQLYAESDGYLVWSMPRETEAFFAEVLDKDLGVANFVDSDWTFVNGRLAQHYDLPGRAGIDGSAVRRVALPPGTHRGGVMTQASVLKVTADGTRTSPVLRGKWVLERIIGQPPSPPPPDVPSIDPDIRGATTIRQQLDKHRNTPACASCHTKIDPPGFALETFDPIGGWRDFYRITKGAKKFIELPNYAGRKVGCGLAVEKGDQTPDGRPFKDVDEYKKLLLADKDQLARNVVQKLMTYATGAEPQFADREEVERMVADVRKKDYGLRTIVHEIVGSRVFLDK